MTSQQHEMSFLQRSIISNHISSTRKKRADEVQRDLIKFWIASALETRFKAQLSLGLGDIEARRT